MTILLDTPVSSVIKESTSNAADRVWFLGWEDTPGEGNGNLLQFSFLENPMDRGAWHATVHSIAKSWTQPKWLSTQVRIPCEELNYIARCKYPNLVLRFNWKREGWTEGEVMMENSNIEFPSCPLLLPPPHHSPGSLLWQLCKCCFER